METEVKQLEEGKVELAVTVPAADVDAAIDAAYKEAGKARIKGFRPGKAPRHVLDNVYGGAEYFAAKAADAVIKDSLPLAVDSHDLIPLDRPDFGDPELVQAGDDYHYVLQFSIAPELELSSYDPVEIELPSAAASDAEVQARIDTMLSYYPEYDPVEGRASATGDVLTIDMEVTQDGERIDDLSGESLPYQLGINSMPEEFEKHFTGIQPGTPLSFDFSLNPENMAEGVEAPTLHVEATLLKITTKRLPELTDAWVQKTLEYEGVEHFRTLLAESIKAQKEAELPRLKAHRVTEALASRLQGDVPIAVVNDYEQDLYRDIFTNMQKQNTSLEAYLASIGMTPQTFREDVTHQAQAGARQALALDAWARHYNLTATDDEIAAEFKKGIAKADGQQEPNEAAEDAERAELLIEEWRSSGRLSEIRQGIRRVKASEQLIEQAIVSEEKAAPPELEVATGSASADSEGVAVAESAVADDGATEAEQSSKSDKPDQPDKSNKPEETEE
ncbi:MAG: trigger factor [Actinomycetia bacterium]|nr:trigger factor [Actinomycetes bacterium]